MTKERKPLRQNPWIIGTGTGIFGVIGVRILDYIAGTNILGTIIKFIKMICSAIGHFFLLKFEVSLWFLIFLPIAVIGLIIIVLWIISLFQNDKNSILNLQPLFLDYKEDNFGGILYRWEYLKNFSDKYEISRISHYCPNCKCSIVYNKCPVCNAYFHANMFKSNYEIDALIRHKIETQINK
jgi:hypothetical protein